jgi:hypothetical protein
MMNADRIYQLVKENNGSYLIQPEHCRTGWFSGSLAEGIGNKGSDLDVFICCDPQVLLNNTFTRNYTGYAVQIHMFQGYRMDFEYWPEDSIVRIAEKLNGIRVDDELVNVLNMLKSEEVDFIHRLKTGRCLFAPDAFEQLKGNFAFETFRRYLVQNKILYVDDAFDDTVGMLESGQTDIAVMRARFTVEMSVDALLYHRDFTNDKAKYRLANLKRMAAEYPETETALKKFWSFQECIPPDEAGRIQFVEDALRFSSEIVEQIQTPE